MNEPKLLLFILVAVACLSFLVSHTRASNCLGCTVAARVVYQVIESQEPNAEKALFRLCDMLSPKLVAPCKLFVTIEGPILIKMLENKQTPDVICQTLKFCTDPQCTLYPKSPFQQQKKEEAYSVRMINKQPWWQKLLNELLEPLRRAQKTHMPLFDGDQDGFSDMFTLRGSAWRGKDCDDRNPQIYPGRKYVPGRDNPAVDNNCNGINGTDPVSGRSYEEMFCSGTPRRGVAVLGDSASAHFRVPEELVMKTGINAKNYKHLMEILGNEADWPHLSTVTGYMNDTTGLVSGPVDSIYLRMKKRNRCIHRDFQNIGVNGASSDNVRNYMLSYRRNQTLDEPVLLFISLVGNDVCSSKKSYEEFTTPDVFHDRMISILDHLDGVLPANSFIVFVGLAQGNILYDALWNQTHPLGVTYEALYDYLNCLGSSPCWGWMNSDPVIRAATTQRAYELSLVYEKIIAEKQGQYRSFKMAYHKFPLESMINEYVKSGGKPKDIIEPFDGFHPSQIGEALISKGLFEWLEKEHPEALGPINPYNEQIDKLFGDQGGY